MLQAIARIAHEEGLLLDVCSEGELHTAFNAGVPARSCVLHGCAKTKQELELAVQCGLRYVVVDHEAEIEALDHIARTRRARCAVLVRVNPGVAAATKSQIQTSAPGSKFGFPVQDGQALDAVRRVAQAEALDFAGLHCHVGSQIFDLQTYGVEIDGLAAFSAQLAREGGVAPSVINVGGGLGVGDNDLSAAPAPEDWADTIFERIERAFARSGAATAASHGRTRPRDRRGCGRHLVPGGCRQNACERRARADRRRRHVGQSAAGAVRSRLPGHACVRQPQRRRRSPLHDLRTPLRDRSAFPQRHSTGDSRRRLAGGSQHRARTRIRWRAITIASPDRPLFSVDRGRARLIARREPLEHLLDLDVGAEASEDEPVKSSS